MRTADYQRFNALMNGMGKVYEREVDKALLDAYWLALADWSLTDFERAVAHFLRTSKFLPRPAEFEELRRASQPTAGEAWARVIAHCAAGLWRKGGTGDPRIDEAVKATGGWEFIAMYDTHRLGILERRFSEHYETIADTVAARTVGISHEPTPLIGNDTPEETIA